MFRVLPYGSLDRFQNLVNPSPGPPPSSLFHFLLRIFLPEDQSSLSLISYFPSLPVHSALPANRAPWRRGPSHISFVLYHPFVQGWMQARGSLNAFVAWINIRDLKLPSSWLGSSWPWGPHTGVSQVRCRLWGVEKCKRTGREQDLSGAPSFTPLLRSVNSSVQRNNQQTIYNERVLFEPHWGLYCGWQVLR